MTRLALPTCLCFATLLLGCGISKPLASGQPDGSPGGDTSAEVDVADDAATTGPVDVGTETDASDDATSDAGDAGAPCLPPTSMVCLEPSPSFANDIVPILDTRCNTCHDGNIPDGPWPLHDLGDVLEWKGLVIESLLDCTMPPPDSGTTLPEVERQRLLAWIACGTPDN